MNVNGNLKSGFNVLGHTLKHQWEKHGSLICTIGGTVALVGSGVHACRKTYKNHDILKDYGKEIKEAQKSVEGEKKITRFIRVAKVKTVVGAKVAAKYAPEIIGSAVGVVGVGKGLSIEHRHFKEAAAFGAATFAQFMDYRKQVIAEHGADADKRYLHGKANEKAIEGSKNDKDSEVVENNDGGINMVVDQDKLHILYSKENTPGLWSPSYELRKANLKFVQNEADRLMMQPGGCYTVNDIRRLIFGSRATDLPWGDIYGRVWDPGNKEHPEKGRFTNLHFEDDEEFMLGAKDWCWLTIEIDPEPIILRKKKLTEVEA